MARSLQPEQAIDGWRRWGDRLNSRPVLLKTLDGGRSNHSFLLDSDIGKLVLRINGAGSLLPGASRGNEIKTWQAASKQGIAPPLLFVDNENRYLVSTYIDNDLPADPRHDPVIIGRAFRLLEACHRLEVDVSRIDYFGHIEHYWQLIEAGNRPPPPELDEQRAPMQRVLASLIESNTPTGLCHHDPVIQNFVGTTGRLYLIDWEYAATGLQIMDYAALAIEWGLDNAVVLEHIKCDAELLNNAKSLYRYLCVLWEHSSAGAAFE